MRAQHFGALLFCAQISHHTIPERTCSTQFRYLHEEIHADIEEERKTTGELVYINSLCHSLAHIFVPILNSEGQFLHLFLSFFLLFLVLTLFFYFSFFSFLFFLFFLF